MVSNQRVYAWLFYGALLFFIVSVFSPSGFQPVVLILVVAAALPYIISNYKQGRRNAQPQDPNASKNAKN